MKRESEETSRYNERMEGMWQIYTPLFLSSSTSPFGAGEQPILCCEAQGSVWHEADYSNAPVEY